MGRLDRHVNLVRNKLAMGTLLKALAWALLGFAFVVLLNILVDKFLTRRLPHVGVFFWVGLGATVTVAMAWSVWRRPTPRQAAVAIDERLGLKEKFSTALYVRSSTDPFAAAAVRDAEVTAENVSLRKRFPVPFPRAMIATITLIVVTLLTARFLPAYPLFADANPPHTGSLNDSRHAETQKMLTRAMTAIDETPVLTPIDKCPVEAARREVRDLLDKPVRDDVAAQRIAQDVMKDMLATKERIKQIQDMALQAKNDSELQTAQNMAAAASALARQMAAQAKAGQAGPGQSIADAQADIKQQLENVHEAADAEAQVGQNDNARAGDGANPAGNNGPGQAQARGEGTWKPGDAQQKTAGAGGPGVSAGGPRPRAAETPVDFKPVVAASVADDKGQPVSSRPVKSTAETGSSHLALSDVIRSAEKDAADEVDQDRISRPEQAVVKRYFDDLMQQSGPAPAK